MHEKERARERSGPIRASEKSEFIVGWKSGTGFSSDSISLENAQIVNPG